MTRPALPAGRETLRDDSVAGLVLGVESVPDGLAAGLLAGVNPVYGLYAYLVGTVAGALATSSVFMTVQATGAMAIVVADVTTIDTAEDPGRALFTLSLLTGVMMVAAGLLRLGTILRFISNAALVGFVNAVGVNIILGQLDNATGYEASGANRVLRALDTLTHPGQHDLRTLLIGGATLALIVALERTRLGQLGMVVAVIATSAWVVVAGWDSVAQLADVADVPRSLPAPVLPDLDLIAPLVIPAVSLAFVGLVQGAGITANFPNPDGTYPEASRDFVGQGAANIACGVFQGMPVGGSMSATSLVKSAGARSRQAQIVAGIVMAAIILLLAPAVEAIAMPALAGLLMLVGYRTIKPHDLHSVARSGRVQATVLVVTFVLTLVIPLQYAVLVGVGLSVVLYVISVSNQIQVKARVYEQDGSVSESDPPPVVPAGTVLVLQPYGSLFFASAPVFEAALPTIEPTSRHSVVILRLRGRTDLGTTFMDVLERYARALRDVDSKLVIVSADERVIEQLTTTQVLDVIGEDNVYEGDEWVGRTVRRAHEDAVRWVDSRRAE
jgi:SulP family sulfate permease